MSEAGLPLAAARRPRAGGRQGPISIGVASSRYLPFLGLAVAEGVSEPVLRVRAGTGGLDDPGGPVDLQVRPTGAGGTSDRMD